MKIRTFVVDAFTDKAFKGNPAGVCLLDHPLDATFMQLIASELKHSETAFIQLSGTGEPLPIRYFTPTVEIAFCGHATLASAKIVLEKLNRKSVAFVTHHQLHLTASKTADEIVMKFPLYDTTPYKVNDETLKALGVTESREARYSKELEMLLIHVSDKKLLLNLRPDFRQLVASDNSIKEVVVTAPSNDEEYDFYSRCFCPWIGIDEDPVTGASHSILARYWGNLLSKSKMKAYQCSERGGYLNLEIKSNTELEVTSSARIVLEGEMNIDA